MARHYVVEDDLLKTVAKAPRLVSSCSRRRIIVVFRFYTSLRALRLCHAVTIFP
jgi:hypothetical protein